jgi:hypothetical protein
MTVCNTTQFKFSTCKGRKVNGQFTGGDITSDGGVMLLSQVDKKLQLTKRLARVVNDPRVKWRCDHSVLYLLRQRIYGLCLGYEDLNDHDTIRKDIGLQTAVSSDRDLASASTLCRFENRVDTKTLWAISEMLVENFIDSFKKKPRELILDFDSTDDPVHGDQIGSFFHGYYDHYCFLPLYVFCGTKLLAAYLRPSNIDNAQHAWAILSLLVKRLRKAWPEVKIIFRADSGFCRHRIFDWCEKHDVRYIVGIAKNSRLLEKAQPLINLAHRQYRETAIKQRLFDSIPYSAHTWKRQRRVIVKAEHSAKGQNPRFVVTNITGEAKQLYDRIYCARGEAENRIKEQQLCLFADRTSCMNWLPNQFRLLLSSLAYVLLEAIRSIALKGTQLANARCDTIRLKLLKIGAVLIRNTRQIRFLLSSAYPYKFLFLLVSKRLAGQ